MANPALKVKKLRKSFTLHGQGAAFINVLNDISLEVYPGECVVLHGESGMGKSTLLRCLYANYLCDSGSITLRHEDDIWEITSLPERSLMQLRREKIAYVSQFLKVIPRVPAFDIVIQPLLDDAVPLEIAQQRVASLLRRLNIPEALWSLSPTTFSGGEQQRINIAREFIAPRPVMLLDEPTASLDSANRQVVLELIEEVKQQQVAIVGIFHDQQSRDRVADRIIDLKQFDSPPQIAQGA